MTKFIASRVTARIDGDFVVFLIGMRINKLWKPHKWVPLLLAMPKMLKELEGAPPEVGFLGHNGSGGRPIVQYGEALITLNATLATVMPHIGQLGFSSTDV